MQRKKDIGGGHVLRAYKITCLFAITKDRDGFVSNGSLNEKRRGGGVLAVRVLARAASFSNTGVPRVLTSVYSIGFSRDSGTLVIAAR